MTQLSGANLPDLRMLAQEARGLSEPGAAAQLYRTTIQNEIERRPEHLENYGWLSRALVSLAWQDLPAAKALIEELHGTHETLAIPLLRMRHSIHLIIAHDVMGAVPFEEVDAHLVLKTMRFGIEIGRQGYKDVVDIVLYLLPYEPQRACQLTAIWFSHFSYWQTRRAMNLIFICCWQNNLEDLIPVFKLFSEYVGFLTEWIRYLISILNSKNCTYLTGVIQVLERISNKKNYEEKMHVVELVFSALEKVRRLDRERKAEFLNLAFNILSENVYAVSKYHKANLDNSEAIKTVYLIVSLWRMGLGSELEMDLFRIISKLNLGMRKELVRGFENANKRKSQEDNPFLEAVRLELAIDTFTADCRGILKDGEVDTTHQERWRYFLSTEESIKKIDNPQFYKRVNTKYQKAITRIRKAREGALVVALEADGTSFRNSA